MFYETAIDIHEESPGIYLQISYVGSTVTVKKEILVYPFESLVAEVGGALGLFLGFSFLMIWDVLEIVGLKLNLLKKIKSPIN